MAAPAAPFPVPSFQPGAGETTTEDLLDHLRALIAANLSGSPSIRIPASNKETWSSLILGLADHFLATFPSASPGLWTTQHEKATILKVALEVIERAVVRVDDLLTGNHENTKRLLLRLFDFLLTAETWDEPMNIERGGPGVPTPKELRDCTINAIAVILVVLCAAPPPPQTAGPSWPYAKALDNCMKALHETIDHATDLAFPLNVSFMNMPGDSDTSKNDIFTSDMSTFTVRSASQYVSLVGDLTKLLASYLVQTPSQNAIAARLSHGLSLAIRRTSDAMLTKNCSLPRKRCAEVLSSMLSAFHLLICSSTVIPHAPLAVPSTILLFRLRSGPSPEWQGVDERLIHILASKEIKSGRCPAVAEVCDILSQEEWGMEGEMLRDCCYSMLLGIVDELPVEILSQLQLVLSKRGRSERCVRLLAAIETKTNASSKIPLSETPNLCKRKRDTVSSRISLLEALRTTIPDIELPCPPEDDNSSDAQWNSRLIEAMKIAFNRKVTGDSSVPRPAVLKALIISPCALAHPEEDICKDDDNQQDRRLTLALIPLCMTALPCLSGDSQDIVPVAALRQCYDALAKAIRHHTQGYGEDILAPVSGSILKGMLSRDRGVRLASGRAMVELFKLHHRIGHGTAKRVESLSASIVHLLRSSKDSSKETALVSLGRLGRTYDKEIMGFCLHCFVTQLGQGNVLIRGLAYTQLLTMGKYHTKTPYLLMAPHMPKLSIYVVTEAARNPNILVEMCRFISLSQRDFLSVTLQHTLPVIFGNCDTVALDTLSRTLDLTPSALFLNASAEVLAHIFLLRGSTPTDNSLAFILRILNDAANDSGGKKIMIFNVVKSCVVPLLVALVIAMGDHEQENTKAAVEAIRKVERILDASSSGRRRNSQQQQRLGNFLKSYMLGVISHMNDILQDAYGRKPDELKGKVLRGLGQLIDEVGAPISNVAPQVMATLQTMICHKTLSDAAIQTWHTFVHTLSVRDLGAYVGPTTAALVGAWSQLSLIGRGIAREIIEYIVLECSPDLGQYLHEVVDLSRITELRKCSEKIRIARQTVLPRDWLSCILQRIYTDNSTVVSQSLEELKFFMLEQHGSFIRGLTSGDIFDPLVGQIMRALLTVACRDGEHAETLHLLAFECIGILGAVDPDRFELPASDVTVIVLSNFCDEGESIEFALHLIKELLVGAFRSTSDIKYQSHLAYAIQELLKFCKFTPELVLPAGASIPLKVRQRWNNLPKHVLETVTPLLEAKFTLGHDCGPVSVQHPIYLHQTTYREWIQLWIAHLIYRASGDMARTIFNVFRSVVKNKDVGVAHQLLPHLVLNILISGTDDDAGRIREEIIAVLQDQLDATSVSSHDKRLLSAQTVFMLMDHLNKWIRILRKDISVRRTESRRSRQNTDIEDQVIRVDSILASIDQSLVAKAAFECKAFARSLMNFEKQILELRQCGTREADLQAYYERLHEIYAHLDEPDGMEGISACIMVPSLEHHIRQHESTGRWTSAQSCWEVRLQQSQDNIEYHLGLLRCLRNLGHYDSLRTHIQGVLIRNPEWEVALTGFMVEGALMANDWPTVQQLVENTTNQVSEVAIARLLLAVRSSDKSAAAAAALSSARIQLGGPISAAGEQGYRRAYNSVLNLHIVQDIAFIQDSVLACEDQHVAEAVASLSRVLSTRMNATLPTFRTREPILSMHRTALSLSSNLAASMRRAVGRAWLSSVKIARKAGHWQTAYSAVLQAREGHAPFSFFQSAKLVKATGEPLRALHEINVALHGHAGQLEHFVNDVAEDAAIAAEKKMMIAKARLLRARWMQESERYDSSLVLKELNELAKTHADMESAQFRAGYFQDECYRALTGPDKKKRGPIMNLYTVKTYALSLRLGSKYAYQTVPRLLTLWLDMGEDASLSQTDVFAAINKEVETAIRHTPVYKWMIAFPQIVSRVDHKNHQAFAVLSQLIMSVLQEYPHQGLWLFMAVVKSTKSKRERRGLAILEQIKNNPRNHNTNVAVLVQQAIAMTTELLRLCDAPLKDDARTLCMSRDFPTLADLVPSAMIIPLQESLTANLPPTSANDSEHQPFPPDAPTIIQFYDEIEVMKSLAKPRKISILGSDGRTYMFLGKPKDDLRKDARLMDFNSIINKLLTADSASRRRRLRIRTYSVVTLNEECGFIQWVPNTVPIRAVLLKYYTVKGIDSWSREMSVLFAKIKESSEKDAAKIFKNDVLKCYPPIFHEWFLDTFPEPSAWLSSRLAYARTAAVMSMVGFILGLGDRHLENILLDANTGDVVHVDFNCLFEKGKTLETPERVPFRLTQNLVAALGVSGVEGVFRVASEITMQLLRTNKDILMSVLDAFVHDPLVEWEDEKRKMERQARGSDRNAVKESVDLRKLAKNALYPIERKLKGLYVKETNRNDKRDREISTVNLVQMLIEEATDLRNLAKMYPGWAPWH